MLPRFHNTFDTDYIHAPADKHKTTTCIRPAPPPYSQHDPYAADSTQPPKKEAPAGEASALASGAKYLWAQLSSMQCFKMSSPQTKVKSKHNELCQIVAKRQASAVKASHARKTALADYRIAYSRYSAVKNQPRCSRRSRKTRQGTPITGVEGYDELQLACAYAFRTKEATEKALMKEMKKEKALGLAICALEKFEARTKLDRRSDGEVIGMLL